MKIGFRQDIIALTALLGVLFWIGCSKEDTSTVGPSTSVEIQWATTPPNLIDSSLNYNPIRVTVTGIASQDIDSVKATIADNTGQEIVDFHLYDDASYYAHDDNLQFCHQYSGDLIANNGTFSRQINSLFASDKGQYSFVANVWYDNQNSTTTEHSIMVATSVPPVLSDLVFPDSLLSGNADQSISLKVVETDDFDTIRSVEMILYSPAGIILDSTELEELDGPSYYGTILSAAYSAGYASGLYTFNFRAWDSFNVASDSLGVKCYIENCAPFLTELSLPDTVVPDTSFLITVRCWDEQTIADIAEVSLQARKPDLTYGSVFQLFDNGLEFIAGDSLWAAGFMGDEVEGDSIYTMTAFIDQDNLIGTYEFFIRAYDKAGNERELIDTLVVVAP